MYWFMKFGIFIGRAQAANRSAQQYRHHSSERIELKPLHAILSSCAPLLLLLDDAANLIVTLDCLATTSGSRRLVLKDRLIENYLS